MVRKNSKLNEKKFLGSQKLQTGAPEKLYYIK